MIQPLSAASGFAASSRTFDPFRTLDAGQRRRHLEGYRRHLERRNGTPDLAARTLSRREQALREIESKSVEWEGEIDPYGFFAHFFDHSAPPAIDARTLWLLVAAKINEGESYGVDLELKAFLERGQEDVDPIELQLMLEEQYHSRILVEACRTCGIELTLQTPRWGQRWMIHLIQILPERLRWIPVLTGEVLGAHLLKVLLDHCHLFAAEPEVEARLRFLLGEIWLDEVFHVAFLRARLQPRAIRMARAMLPLAMRTLMNGIPELSVLGCDRRELTRRLASEIEIPPGMDWMEDDQHPPA